MLPALPTSVTIPQLLQEQASRFPQREALVSGSSRLNYAGLQARTLEVARALRAWGVRRGDHVAILMGNRTEWVLSFLAVQCLGAVAVALNTWATPRELGYALAHAEVSTLIAVDRFRHHDYRDVIHRLRAEAGLSKQLSRVVWVPADPDTPSRRPPDASERTWGELLAIADRTSPATLDDEMRAVQPDDVGMLLYTSGSTAAPKGILLQHRHWLQNAFHIGQRQRVTERDRLWLAVSLFWSFGCVNALPNLLTHGGCVVLQEHFDAGEALALMAAERCSVLYATPNMLQALHSHPSRPHTDLSALRSGATIGTPEQIALAIELGARSICNVYGLSETYGNCAVTDAQDSADIRLTSVGRPLSGVRIRICDIATGVDLPAGTDGEIRVDGPLFKAYFKDPDQTRLSFDEQGFFRTGDLGQIDAEGRLHFRGRLKEMIKSGGINIAPMEVEEALMRHPGVQTAYVIGVPDAKLDEALVAIVIPRRGHTPAEADLRHHCRAELAAYKVPQRIHFTTEDQLPLTTTGKVQKLRLHELLT